MIPASVVTKVKRQRVLVQMIEGLASIALGLGLYGYFVEDKGEFFAFLNEPNLALILMVIGGSVSTLASLKLIALNKQLNKS